MDRHALEYYKPFSDESPHGHFHQVIALHEQENSKWEKISKLAPSLCKGWYELARLDVQDRIDFTREFWLTKMPYHPQLNELLTKFFASLDDIGVFLVQSRKGEPFEPQIVYSLSKHSGFFQGKASVIDSEIIALQKVFPDYILPIDYLAFLQIHNGFAKLTDTGIMQTNEVKDTYFNFQAMLDAEEPLITSKGREINPKSLIPFYKSFGMPFFQCFWGEWYPEGEMGNVYYSGLTKTISDCTKADFRVETMAFETFTDWLMFYLEAID